MKRILFVKFVALFVLLAGCTAKEEANFGVFIESECPFDLPGNLVLGENFKFGYVSVPEFHNQKRGNSIKLAVAIFPATGDAPKSDPIVMNTSGPGKSNMDNFIPDLAGELGNYLLPNRDVVIIELRGLRYSSTYLKCAEVHQVRKDMLEENVSKEETAERIHTALKATKKRFDKEGINLSAYNNVETAADIAMVMKGLGYEQFNLVGSSAGTLVAHHVIRDYPEMVRCAVLDAGLPIDPTIMVNYVPSFIQMLKTYFTECEADAACNAAYPNLEERFLALLDSLNENPVSIDITDPVSYEKISYKLTGERLSSFVAISMFYNTQIPALLNELIEREFTKVSEFVQYSLMDNYFADGLGYTVFITEMGEYNPGDIEIDLGYEVFADGLSSMGMGGEYLYDVQQIWQLDKLKPAEISYKTEYSVPVAVFNGKYDPAIPVRYDSVMKVHLKNCYIYRFDGVPHSAFDNATPCVLPMMLEFLENPSKAPNSDCVSMYEQKYATE